MRTPQSTLILGNPQTLNPKTLNPIFTEITLIGRSGGLETEGRVFRIGLGFRVLGGFRVWGSESLEIKGDKVGT